MHGIGIRAVALTSIQIISAIIITIVLVSRHAHLVTAMSQSALPPTQMVIGEFSDAGPQPKVLVALATACAWDSEFAEFYTELTVHDGEGFQMVVVGGDSPDEIRRVADQLSARVPRIQQIAFSTLRVHTAPAIILLGGDNAVEAAWPAKSLSAVDRAYLRERLGLPTESPGATRDITAVARLHQSHVIRTEDARVLRRSFQVPTVDVRPRADYARESVQDSVNIPLDELPVRAPHELPLSGTIIVLCGACKDCGREPDESRLSSLCTRAYQELTSLGFSDVRVLRENPGAVAGSIGRSLSALVSIKGWW